MPDARTKAEKRLHTFVGVVAFLERTGNALGRLVLIWATVVVGFSKDLGDHFWYLAALVILESFRAFSRESKSDDQLLFKTTGGINIKRASLHTGSGALYYVNAMAIGLFVFGTVVGAIPYVRGYLGSLTVLPLLAVLSKVNSTWFPKIIEKMSEGGSSWWLRYMPAAALFVPLVLSTIFGPSWRDIGGAIAIPLWFIFDYSERGPLPQALCCLQGVKHLRAILITGMLVALLVARGFIGFVTLAPLVLGNLQIPLSITRIALPLCIFWDGSFNLVDPNKTHLVRALKVLYIIVMCQGMLYILACILESFSYFPRSSLALHCGLVNKMGLESISIYYEQTYDTFVQDSILDTKDIGLVKFAVNSLNSKVSREKKLASVQILHSLLQQEKEEASNTEVVSEITGSTKAVDTMISMLGSRVPEDTDIRLFATKVVADLAPYLSITGFPGTMQMVSSLLHVDNQPGRDDSSDHRVERNTENAGDQERRDAPSSSRVDGTGGGGNTGDQERRDSLGSSRVGGNEGNDGNQERRDVPGSSLVDGNGGNTGDQERRDAPSSSRGDGNGGNAGDQEGRDVPGSSRVNGNGRNAGNQERRDASGSSRVDGNGGNARNQETERAPSSPTMDPELGNAHSTQVSHGSEGRSRICKFFCLAAVRIGKFCHYMKRLCLFKEDSLKGEDSLPELGMLILQRFADDVDNCAEISRATEVLPRIIGLISHITDTTTPQRKQVTTSSLVLVAKLASVEWKSGVTLRKELSENPFLLSKLADILDGSCSGPEQWKPAMDIIARLAMDEETRQEIGGIQVIIPKLMHAFVGPSNTYDPSLRTAAGQALAMLAMESGGNCSAILDEPGYNRIVDLNKMFIDHDNEYLTANILRSLWAHSRYEPRHRDNLNSHMSPAFIVEVLGRIMGAEGKRMETLIGLASQICNAIPQAQLFINTLESHPGHAEAFVQKLVDELNANRRPSPEFPTMRRALIELTISMVRSCGRCAVIFRDQGMVEALCTVEKTPSKVEKYRLYYGGTGVVPLPEGAETLSNLAATAKELIDAQ